MPSLISNDETHGPEARGKVRSSRFRGDGETSATTPPAGAIFTGKAARTVVARGQVYSDGLSACIDMWYEVVPDYHSDHGNNEVDVVREEDERGRPHLKKDLQRAGERKEGVVKQGN